MSTSILWNTVECCCGFEDMKGEISSSLKFLIFLGSFFIECAILG